MGAKIPVLLTIKQALARVPIGRSTLHRIVRDGELPAVRIRGRVFILEEDLSAYITSRTDAPREESGDATAEAST